VEVPSLAEVEVSEKRRGKARKAEAEVATVVETVVSEAAPVTVAWGEVRLPISSGDAGYCMRHLEVQLSPSEAETLKRLVLGLQMAGETLGDRKVPIRGAADAVRWAMKQIRISSEKSDLGSS